MREYRRFSKIFFRKRWAELGFTVAAKLSCKREDLQERAGQVDDGSRWASVLHAQGLARDVAKELRAGNS